MMEIIYRLGLYGRNSVHFRRPFVDLDSIIFAFEGHSLCYSFCVLENKLTVQTSRSRVWSPDC